MNDCRPEGFQWIEANDAESGVYAWLRKGRDGDPMMAVAVNMTPVERLYRLGLPVAGGWAEVLNTDAAIYGGGNRGNLGGVATEKTPRTANRNRRLSRCRHFRQSICGKDKAGRPWEGKMKARPNQRLSAQAMAFVLPEGAAAG